METKIQALLDKKGHDVYSIQANQTVYEAITEMDVRNVGGLIVKNGQEVVGIITERDYTRKVILRDRSSKETTVEEIMTSSLVTVTPDETVRSAMAVMTENRCRHLPVMKDGKLEIRETKIVFRDADYAYIREGLDDGDEVVTTTLATVADVPRLPKIDSPVV